jgi:hypothetical protein
MLTHTEPTPCDRMVVKSAEFNINVMWVRPFLRFGSFVFSLTVFTLMIRPQIVGWALPRKVYVIDI